MIKKICQAALLMLPFLPAAVAAVEALPVREVAPGLYVHLGEHELPDTHNHGAIANIGFVIGERCVAVIDSGGNPEQGYALKAAIAQKTAKPVCYVINTHVHPDHIYGNIAFKGAGVQFVGHHKLPRAMALRKSYYAGKAAEQIGVAIDEAAIIAPDITVENEHSLDLGKRTLVLMAHRTAHTDNDLSVYDPQTDTVWLADLLFIEHIPVIDGSLLGWLQELAELEQRNFTTVIPGHGPIVIDWPKSMQPEKAYLTMLRDEIRAAQKQGRYLEEAVKTVGLSAQGQWLLFEQFHRKNVTTAFAELEWAE